MIIKKLWADLETFSATPIKNGTYRYAEDSEILLLLYAIDDEEPRCWDFTDPDECQDNHTDFLMAFNYSDCEIWFQNSMFDRSVFNYNGFPSDISRWRDTLIQAYCHALPGSLEKLCEVLGVPQEFAKLKDGRSLIQLFCKPRPKNMKLRRATRDTHPEEWKRFIEYGKNDITAMRECHKRMPQYNYPNGPSGELTHWHLDQKINDRGFCVDMDLVKAAIDTVKKAKGELKEQVVELTEGAVTSATKRDQVLEYILEEHGILLEDLKKGNVEKAMNNPDLPRAMRELLAIRLQATATSTSKYISLLKAVNDDARCRGTIQFGGASRTLRASGRTFQPQNLPSRGLLENHEIDFGIEMILADEAGHFFPNVVHLLTSCVRSVLRASPGKKLVIADLSNIEGRLAAWIAGEMWKLEAFREFDAGIGPDLYNVAYSKAFRIPVDRVTKKQRAIGKVLELACLHPDTQVLTNTGVKRIVEVLITDKLWDGLGWVEHRGLVERGVKKVVPVAGTGITPDHLILINRTWTPARLLVSNESILCRALETGSEGLRSLDIRIRLQVKWRIGCLYVATVVRNAIAALRTCEPGAPHNAANVDYSAKDATENIYTATKASYPTKDNAPDYSHVFRRRSLDAIPRTIGNGLLMVGEVLRCAKNGEKTDENFWNILLRFQDGASALLKWIGWITIKVTNQVISDSFLKKLITLIDELYPSCRKESMNLSPVYDIANAGANNRFTIITAKGTLIVHNCGYQGGVGAFVTMALGYGFDIQKLAEDNWETFPQGQLNEANRFYAYALKKNMKTYGLSKEGFIACDVFKRLWRESNPMIARMWTVLENSIRTAIANPGEVCEAGDHLRVRRDTNWLRLRLPSGRYLCYASPRVDEKGGISYMGLNNYTRKWQRLKGYGGLFLENICQATARDILYASMPKAEAAGYEIVLHVHDELVTETPNTKDFTHVRLSEIMASEIEWAAGLPLAAAGFESQRYRK